jgi:release factor glutamine methyltransferase
MKVSDLLNETVRRLEAAGIESARLQAELLLAFVLEVTREGLYVDFAEPVTGETPGRLETLVRRRIDGEPLQHILGRQEFWSIPFRVGPQVLIPRPETELLVEEALKLLAGATPARPSRVLDLGSGSGAIAVALAREVPSVSVVASDLSPEAMVLARENAREMGVLDRVCFVVADLFSAFRSGRPDGCFDFILSNPPYIPRPELERLSREVADFEPRLALDGGEDGLDLYRRLLSEAGAYVKPGGWILVEVGQGQAGTVAAMMEGMAGFGRPEILPDLAGIDRVVKIRYSA